MVRKEYPSVHLIKNTQNLGFAKANNQVLKQLKDPYCLILNPDTQLLPGCLETLMNVLTSQDTIAACGPRMLNPDKTPQHLGFYRRKPSLIQALLFYTDLYRLAIKNTFLVHHFWESDIDGAKSQSVDQIPGACLLAKTALLRQVGFFNEKYHLWFEDVELCYRLRKQGYQLMYVPESEIIHVGGGAFDNWQDRESKEFRFFHSLFLFFDQNYSLLSQLLIRLIISASLLFMVVSRLLMQPFGYNQDRQKFIVLKWRLFQRLL